MAYDKQEVHDAEGNGKETTTYLSELKDLLYTLFNRDSSQAPEQHEDENRRILAEGTRNSTIGKVNDLYSSKKVPLGSDARVLIQEQERAMNENPDTFEARHQHELDMINRESEIAAAFRQSHDEEKKKGENTNQKDMTCHGLGAHVHRTVASVRAATSSIYNMFPMMADHLPGTGHPYNEIKEASSSSSSDSAESAKDEASSSSSSDSAESAKDEASSSSSSDSVERAKDEASSLSSSESVERAEDEEASSSIDPGDREDGTAEFNSFSVI